jgi:hypothetical protein
VIILVAVGIFVMALVNSMFLCYCGCYWLMFVIIHYVVANLAVRFSGEVVALLLLVVAVVDNVVYFCCFFLLLLLLFFVQLFLFIYFLLLYLLKCLSLLLLFWQVYLFRTSYPVSSDTSWLF